MSKDKEEIKKRAEEALNLDYIADTSFQNFDFKEALPYLKSIPFTRDEDLNEEKLEDIIYKESEFYKRHPFNYLNELNEYINPNESGTEWVLGNKAFKADEGEECVGWDCAGAAAHAMAIEHFPDPNNPGYPYPEADKIFFNTAEGMWRETKRNKFDSGENAKEWANYNELINDAKKGNLPDYGYLFLRNKDGKLDHVAMISKNDEGDYNIAESAKGTRGYKEQKLEKRLKDLSKSRYKYYLTPGYNKEQLPKLIKRARNKVLAGVEDPYIAQITKEEAREAEQILELLEADKIFTGGNSESENIAIVRSNRLQDKQIERTEKHRKNVLKKVLKNKGFTKPQINHLLTKYDNEIAQYKYKINKSSTSQKFYGGQISKLNNGGGTSGGTSTGLENFNQSGMMSGILGAVNTAGSFIPDDNISEGGKAAAGIAHGVGDSLLQSGNPIAMAVGAATKIATWMGVGIKNKVEEKRKDPMGSIRQSLTIQNAAADPLGIMGNETEIIARYGGQMNSFSRTLLNKKRKR